MYVRTLADLTEDRDAWSTLCALVVADPSATVLLEAMDLADTLIG